MKKTIILAIATLAMMGCHKKETFTYNVDKFYDLEILRFKVPGFEQLSLQQKTMLYYLNEAALYGQDIVYDQNCRYNLRIRRALEHVYLNYTDKQDEQFLLMEKYLKRVWFSNGIHHHYAEEKFLPEFSREWFEKALATTGKKLNTEVLDVMFCPNLMFKRMNTADGVDLIQTSAGNYYGEGVTQAEAEAWYEAHKDNSEAPLWIGLNSQLVKENGQIVERVYKVGGLYSAALEKVVENLEMAIQYAETDIQREAIQHMINFNKTGDLAEFNAYCIAWVKDLDSRVDFVNGFTETYSDPLGITGTWESLTNFKDLEGTKRAQLISQNAQWFEDNSTTDKKYKKEEVKDAKYVTIDEFEKMAKENKIVKSVYERYKKLNIEKYFPNILIQILLSKYQLKVELPSIHIC